MHRFFLFLAMLAIGAAETAALACTCIALPTDAAERQSLVTDIVDGAVALIEVELDTAYDVAAGRGERLRVVSTLAGAAPAIVEIERDGPPDGVRCDLEFRSGERTIVLLYPQRSAAAADGPRFRLADRCLTQLVGDAGFRAELVAAMAAR
ncbi:MAG TPA: hypothetical protein VEW25_05065 [Allosphingosinicella sp.]|nr:hypothetical protein [Allosphingosinicella sp.]